MKYFHFTIRWT